MIGIVLHLVGLAAGAALGAGGLAWWRRRKEAAWGPDLLPADVYHMTDLLRRAHNAMAACVVAPEADPIWSKREPELSGSLLERTIAVARMALADGQEHVMRKDNVIVAAGDGYLGCAVVFEAPDIGDADVERVAADLRRLLAEYQITRSRELRTLEEPRNIPEWLAGGRESIEGIGLRLCEAVRGLTGHAAAVVMRDSTKQVASILSISEGADRRLSGSTITPESVVGRASMGDAPVVGTGSGDLFGRTLQDRRRSEERGIAFPLRDGAQTLGALVVFGQEESFDDEMRERLMALVSEAGPRFGQAAAVRAVENQGMTDEVTGLPNRQGLERAMRDYADGECSMLCVEIDQHGQLSDRFGHPGSDAALRHAARVFWRTLRDNDVAARIGDGEVALLLPDTPFKHAIQVAERLRIAVSKSPLSWGGEDTELTCSIGVASVPEIVSEVNGLMEAAHKALEQAKEEGRNRVTAAAGSKA